LQRQPPKRTIGKRRGKVEGEGVIKKNEENKGV